LGESEGLGGSQTDHAIEPALKGESEDAEATLKMETWCACI